MCKEFDESILRMRIAERRKSKGLNQAQLARKAGITPAAISQIENGHRIPSLMTLYHIACALRISIDYLVGRR